MIDRRHAARLLDMGRGAVVGVATWSARHPWLAIAGWVLFLALCVAAGTAAGTNKGAIADFRVGEAGRAEALLDAGGLAPAPVEQILVTARSGPLADTAVDAVVRDLDAGVPGVLAIGAPVRSADGGTMRVPVTLAGGEDSAKTSVRGLLDRVAAVQATHPDVTIAETGSASISVGVGGKLGADLGRTEMISLPITFVILLVVFGAMLAAGLPVLLAFSAFLGSVGLYALASWVFPDAGGAVVSVVFLLGMAVGVDYALFYLKRVREERGTRTPAAAVEAAAATSGRAVVTSGIAVIVALAGLYLVEDVIFSSIATGAILVVAVAVASSLTVLPALLVVLGRRIGGRRHRATPGGRWAAVLRPAMRRPVATLLVGVVATAALAAPAIGMRLGNEGTETFPTSVPAVAAYAQLTRAFPAEGTEHLVVVRTDSAHAAYVSVALRGLAERLAADGPFLEPRLAASADGTMSLLRVTVPYPENSAAARTSLERLRTQLLPSALRLPSTEYAVTGDVARGVDYSAHQAERIPWVIGFVSLATLLVMAVAFGSLVLAAVGVVINLAAVTAAWGVITLVFQGTWAEALLGFTSTDFIGSRMPLMVFAILAGLSTDYQIFVVSRIREAVLRGVPTRRAVLDGIAGTAGVVTSAAVIMISVFVSFTFIDRVELKEVGIGLTVAVLFDAVVLRALILPAVMTLLGERTWWPMRPPTRSLRTAARQGGDFADAV